MVNYDIQSGFFVTSIPFVSNNVTTTKLYQPASTSILSIKEVHLKNAGNYTCAPPNAKPSSIMVHVLRGMSVFFSIFYLLSSVPSIHRFISFFFKMIITFCLDEKPAAMQHANRSSVEDIKSKSNSLQCKNQTFWFLMLLYLICMYKINR